MTAFKFDSPLDGETPLLIGVNGPPGAGKTFTALMLAEGIQRVRGGDVLLLDTEGGRSRAYRDRFKFKLQMMDAPFCALRFVEAIEAAEAAKAACLIIDSMSDEHEGPGGTLAKHGAELDRMAGDDWGKRERMSQAAWIRPKADRLKLCGKLLRVRVPIICAFRAREKTKPMKNERGKIEPTNIGFQPIAPAEIVHTMGVNLLLPPFSQGVPTWESEKVGESFLLKLADPFKPIFARRGPVISEQGEALAQWARGGKVATTAAGKAATTLDARAEAACAALHAAPDLAALERVNAKTQGIRDEAFAANRDDLCTRIRKAYGERRSALDPNGESMT